MCSHQWQIYMLSFCLAHVYSIEGYRLHVQRKLNVGRRALRQSTGFTHKRVYSIVK